MLHRTRPLAHYAATLALLITVVLPTAAAQVVYEDFNAVTETGGGVFLWGQGYGVSGSWDDGLEGEGAFAGTRGNANFGAASAFGTATGGVAGTGGGVIDVYNISYDLVRESFAGVTETGGGVFLAGDGTPNTFNYVTNWDDGIVNEGAFGGTYDGAVLTIGGEMLAEGLATGGAGGSGGARVDVHGVTLNGGNWYAGLQWEIGALPGSVPLLNPGFDDGMDNWGVWNNAYSVAGTEPAWVDPNMGALSPPNVLKMWGPFTGGYNTSGVWQDVAAEPGQTWALSCFVAHPADDAVVGQNFLEMVIEFRTAADVLIAEQHLTVLDPNSPTDTWMQTPILQAVAPAETAAARALLVFHQPGGWDGGAAIADDVRFAPAGGSGLDLAAFTLTANVKGIVEAGEQLGAYQLRLEDSDGNRLIFSDTATSDFEQIGGLLSTATEADPNGDPASGVFNVDSPWHRVVVAFDNDVLGWGDGGELRVDDVLLANDNPAGSSWYAGLYWEDLTLPIADLDRLYLTADVLGSKVNAGYQVRLEAFQNTLAGLDEDYATATGDCGTGDPNSCLILDAIAGETFGYSTDFDSGIEGEAAFAGTEGPVSPFGPNPGVIAQGDPNGYLRLQVEGLNLGLDATWWAGVEYGNQGFASGNLAEIELRADVRAMVAWLGGLGWYELRIEDEEKDRLVFQVNAEAVGADVWHAVGGTLDNAVEMPPADPGLVGDGFDTDDTSYNVVVAFVDEPDKPLATTWGAGGILEIDNFYLTPAAVKRELSRFVVEDTTSPDFDHAGAFLAELPGSTVFGDYDEDFDAVTGTGGGEIWGGGSGVVFEIPFDDGIEGEEAFAGTWGSGSLGPVNAWGCTDCGTDGGGAGNVSIVTPDSGTEGGWWAGLSWQVPPPDWSDLTAVTLTADVKASKLAPFILRIEDPTQGDPIWFAFEHTPTTTDFESVGGPLSSATQGCPNPPCPPFNFNAPFYKATLVFEGDADADDWTPDGGQLTLDNLHFTGLTLDAADSYTIVVTFQDEVVTWGTEGALTIDNLGILPAAECNGDRVVDLADVALVQQLDACGDLDGDGDVDADDLALMGLVFTGPAH